MPVPGVIRRVPRWAHEPGRGWRATAGAILDSTPILAAFGVALPLLYAMAVWDPIFFLAPPVRPRVRFDLKGHEMLALEVSLALLLGAWAFLQPRTPGWSRIFAVALSVGTALAAAYSVCLAMAIPAGIEDAVRSSFTDVLPLLLTTAFAGIPMLTSVVFFRQASLAWKCSATPGTQRPGLRVLMIAGACLLICALTLWASSLARDLAIERLGTAGPDAVASALGPLRLAAFLGGEDRILHDVYSGQEFDSLLQVNFNQAFELLTGQTAEERFTELHAD